jgi:hypothetical protein
MKIRNGFVSNSSSSSFVIPKDKLGDYEIHAIHDHINLAEKHDVCYDFGCISYDDAWSISEDDYYIMGSTHMDNFNMHKFLIKFLKIPRDLIKWEY